MDEKPDRIPPPPQKRVDKASANTERSVDQRLHGTETILVCDDDELILDSTARLVRLRGYTVLRALGPLEALEAAASHAETIDLLLTDVVMPEMNGWELAQKLAEDRPDMKVIFVSGHTGGILEDAARDGEQIDFLQKPVESHALFRRIRDVLDTTS